MSSYFTISSSIYYFLTIPNADFAVRFLEDAFRRYGIKPGQLVVHSDNGASMKAAPTLALLEKNGITFSHSRPRVSNDNPYSESFFRTLK